MKTNVLTVFRHQEAQELVAGALSDDYVVTAAEDGAAAIAMAQTGDYSVVVSDDTLDDMSGEELATRARQVRPGTRVLIASTRENIENALSVLGHGDFVYVEKPLSPARVRHAVAVEFERARVYAENWSLRARVDGMDAMGVLIGTSMAIENVRERIKYVAAAAANVLITGANGTGKVLAAEAVHRAGDRAAGPLIRVDCATTPDEILENELFGFDEQGDGPKRRRTRGKVELSGDGTLLILEIGDMSGPAQARLADVLAATPELRVIATTRHDLRERAGRGEFREDLYYAINVLGVDMPTLRERRADIPALAAHFVRYVAARNAVEPIELSSGALERIMSTTWPGNVRELQNVIERTTLLSGGGRVNANDLRMNERNTSGLELDRVEKVFRTGSIREMEKLMILGRLQELDDNRTRSAESLEISVRTLRNKLNEYSVTRRNVVRDRETVGV